MAPLFFYFMSFNNLQSIKSKWGNMKNGVSVIALFILLCLVFGCRDDIEEKPGYAANNQTDAEALKAWYHQKTMTTNAGDVEGLRILFTEDVVFMPPGGPLFQGWGTYREWAVPYFHAYDIEEQISYEEIEIFGDRAYMRTSYTMRSTPKAGGNPITAEGKAIWLFGRQGDGSWKGTHCIWNENGGPPADGG